MTVDGCEIKSIQSDILSNNRQRILIIANTKLKYSPKVTKQKILIVPEKERKELEGLLHIIGNLISISEFRERDILSPMPCIAFVPESQDELDFLNNTGGIQYFAKELMDFRFSLYDIITKYPLFDRQEGCEFIAIALSSSSAVGQLHEYIRFFERAFSLTSNCLVDALWIFLQKSDVIYTKDEINRWIINLRDGATHADRRNNLIYESDAQNYILRMRQAAYDVLFNKSNWHDPSTTRRQAYIAPAGLLEDNTPYFTVKSPKFEGICKMRDPFDAFNLDLMTSIIPVLNAQNYWFKKYGSDDAQNMLTEESTTYVLSLDEKKTIHNKYRNTQPSS